MAHPHLMLLADGPQAIEQRGRGDDVDEGAAELAAVGRDHRAAELLVQRLLTIADAEQRKPAIEQGLWGARAVLGRHRGRSAGEDDALGPEPLERLLGGVERSDLAIDARLAHAPGDQL